MQDTKIAIEKRNKLIETIKKENFSLDYFQYTCDKIKENTWGKCVTSFNPITESIIFRVGKPVPILEYFPKVPTTHKELLSAIYGNIKSPTLLGQLTGSHEHILQSKEIPLGGGFYIASSIPNIILAGRSGNLGAQHLDLTTRCLQSHNYKLENINPDDFSSLEIIEYLSNAIEKADISFFYQS